MIRRADGDDDVLLAIGQEGHRRTGRADAEIDRLAKQVEQVLKTVPGTSSAYAERTIGGYYLEIVPDRSALARRQARPPGVRRVS